MKKKINNWPKLGICINNKDYEGTLILNKLYRLFKATDSVLEPKNFYHVKLTELNPSDKDQNLYRWRFKVINNIKLAKLLFQ